MANLGKVVYLTEAQKNTLFSAGTITVDGVTVTYSANDLYVTPQQNPAMETVQVSGSTPSITGVDNTRYICGEVSTLTIVPPASGIIDVRFESGSTATVLTVTPPTGLTMQYPAWFDPTDLEANTTYEISIEDGIYAVVMVWG